MSAAGSDAVGVSGDNLHPFATLSRAVTAAAANDTIYIDKGTFSDNFYTLNKTQ